MSDPKRNQPPVNQYVPMPRFIQDTPRGRMEWDPYSRLANDRLLRTWSGASGSAPLTYRWSQVRGIVRDLHDGRQRDARP